MRAVQHRIDEIPLPSPPARGRLFVTNFSAVGPDPQSALDRVEATSLVCLLTPDEIRLRYPDYIPWLLTHMPPWLASQVNQDDLTATLAEHAERFGEFDLDEVRFRSDFDARALWLPTPDGYVTFDDALMGTVAYANDALYRGSNVLVHCGAGMARTAVLGILTMISLGADPSEAPTDFRAARPGGGPDGPPQQDQIERLIDRARRLIPFD
ncbi:hypothetical protein [Candidatus Poriferisodalis sp.]|uniref:hypothetical protein n=1 Tax=Candidatus Poriferisodalis sp. TaxID=3101277 RepID=UPI003B516589